MKIINKENSWYLNDELEKELLEIKDKNDALSFILKNDFGIKDYLIDNLINVDFIKISDSIEIHEVKKTEKMDNSHEFQLLYYMFYLKNEKDIDNIRGFLDYPKNRKKKEVFLTKEKEDELVKIIEDIDNIIKNNMPKPKKSKICRKCAYFEFCFS